MTTPSATAPAGQVLLLPLTVKHSGHGVGCFSIYDANGSSLGIDFEEDTAGAIVTAVNTHSQLLAQNAQLLSLVKRYASECAECGGTGTLDLTTGNTIFKTADFYPRCPACADIRAALSPASGGV